MSAPPPSSRLQQLLQSAVQSVQWTYILFWQLCPQKGVLVWGEGYYNGAIKTRKTVQPMEVSAEEASLHRSQQLRELYDSLSAGEAGQQARRPCAALSPEDLTEPEWFYLMCVSFSFPPSVGIPGEAFAKQRHVWLTRANEVDSKVFSRAILAKSAGIQTVMCIPLLDGVLELGTTEKVEEDEGLIQHVKTLFADYQGQQPKPALSEHSTSNPVAFINQTLFSPQSLTQPINIEPHGSNQHHDNDDDDDDVEEEDDDDEEVEARSVSETILCDSGYPPQPIHHILSAAGAAVPATGPSELIQIEMSEGIRFASPDDCSNNLDSELRMLAMGHTSSSQSDQRDATYQAWNFLNQDLCNELPEATGATQIQDTSLEDAHYSVTVSAILQQNSMVDSNSIGYLACSKESAFSKYNYGENMLPLVSEGTSQWVLKYMLFSVPYLHSRYQDENSPKSRDGEEASRFRRSTPQEEVSGNHVLAERRRREKLNERFIILRSLVPFVTKMDKASILGDTIEYVKQLRRQIQDLEAWNRRTENNQRFQKTEVQRTSTSKEKNIKISSRSLSEKRKLRLVEGGGGAKAVEAPTNVQVSIIEADALLELQCPYSDGLLLEIIQTLHELQLEITSIQSSSAGGTFVAELRGKVKEVHGKKASIVEVKKAIHQVQLEGFNTNSSGLHEALQHLNLVSKIAPLNTIDLHDH